MSQTILLSRTAYTISARGPFLDTALSQRINGFVNKSYWYGFIKSSFKVQQLFEFDSVTHDLFTKMQSPNHCLYPLLSPHRSRIVLYSGIEIEDMITIYKLQNCSSNYMLKFYSVFDLHVLHSYLHKRKRQSWGLGFHFRLSVCLSVFPHGISKTDAAKMTKLDKEMFHDESWKPVYFGVKGQGHESQKHSRHRFFTAWRYASAVYAVVMYLSVRLSVRHKPALYRNG